MTISNSILLALIGKTVSFKEKVLDQTFDVTGEIQGICFDVSGSVEFFVNDNTYSLSNFDGFDFKIH